MNYEELIQKAGERLQLFRETGDFSFKTEADLLIKQAVSVYWGPFPRLNREGLPKTPDIIHRMLKDLE